MKSLFLAAALAVIVSGVAFGQAAADSTAPAPPRWLWTANLPGGTVKVRIQQVTSVGFSRYTVEGGFRVTELVIDTTGNNSIRIYAIEHIVQAAGGNTAPQTAIGILQDKVQEAANHAASVMGGSEVVDDMTSTMVFKKYPEATHAHTIEYRVATPKEVYDIYRSADSAWESGQGGTYTTATGPLVIQ